MSDSPRRRMHDVFSAARLETRHCFHDLRHPSGTLVGQSAPPIAATPGAHWGADCGVALLRSSRPDPESRMLQARVDDRRRRDLGLRAVGPNTTVCAPSRPAPIAWLSAARRDHNPPEPRGPRCHPAKLGQGGARSSHGAAGGRNSRGHLPAYRHQDSRNSEASSIRPFTAMKIPGSVAVAGSLIHRSVVVGELTKSCMSGRSGRRRR
jgi:hypothetical protein